MSRKEVEESKLYFTPAKKPKENRGKTTFLEGMPINKKDKIKSSAVEFHFKEMGKLTEETNSSYAMRREQPGGITEYFIKFATTGPGVGRILNPWGIYFTPGDEFKFEKQMGRKRYEFSKVSQNVFENYIKFLETRNTRYILNAEREVKNGTQ
jgi:hypothetical protein